MFALYKDTASHKVGRFTKDPVLRYLSGNRVQTHFSLAINRNFKNNHGE